MHCSAWVRFECDMKRFRFLKGEKIGFIAENIDEMVKNLPLGLRKLEQVLEVGIHTHAEKSNTTQKWKEKKKMKKKRQKEKKLGGSSLFHVFFCLQISQLFNLHLSPSLSLTLNSFSLQMCMKKTRKMIVLKYEALFLSAKVVIIMRLLETQIISYATEDLVLLAGPFHGAMMWPGLGWASFRQNYSLIIWKLN